MKGWNLPTVVMLLTVGHVQYNYDKIRRHDRHLTSLLIHFRSAPWRARHREEIYIFFLYKSATKWQFWQTNNPVENTLHLFAGDILKFQMYFIYQHRRKYVSAPLQKNYMSRAATSIWNIPPQWNKDRGGGSGEKVDTLRGDSIDHYERKSYMNMCLIVNGYRQWSSESTELRLLDFCLCGWMKREVQKRKMDRPAELLACILVTAGCIKKHEE
jgi:hypothetical protein